MRPPIGCALLAGVLLAGCGGGGETFAGSPAAPSPLAVVAPQPNETPSAIATPDADPQPTATPSRDPVAVPAGGPTGGPSGGPSGGPTGGPTGGPSGGPTGGPSGGPSGGPRGQATVEPAWEVGTKPLPRRPDGFGEIGPTPKALRHRALPTVDLLPPPADGQWASSTGPISEDARKRTGTAWQPGCPVPLEDLRYLTVSFRGFDSKAHTGEMIVHRKVADDVVSVFRKLFRADFPIESMRIVTGADLDAAPTGDGNNTAGFACRTARGQTRWSAHAYGLAVDVNPFHNPYSRGDLVLPELASSYRMRDRERPGMILPGDVVTKAFAAIGWPWGGDWRKSKDYQHFSQTGL